MSYYTEGINKVNYQNTYTEGQCHCWIPPSEKPPDMPNFYCFFLWTRVLFNITNLYQIYRLGCLTSLNSMLVVIQLFKWLKHYMVPVGIASYVLAAYPLCFRGCGQKRVAFHIWWQCLKVRRFSIWVYNFIYSLTQVHLIKSRNMNYYAVRWKVHRDIRKDWLHFFFVEAK